jgi:hypothetical protein
MDETIYQAQLTPATFMLSIACLMAWREEVSNGLAGMVGVLHVVRNRAKAGWFEGDFYKGVIAKNQFSSMVIPNDGQLTKWPILNDPNYGLKLQQLLHMAPAILSGAMDDQDPTAGAVFYADLQNPGFQKDGWFARVVLADDKKYPCVAKIGSTTYYAEK